MGSIMNNPFCQKPKKEKQIEIVLRFLCYVEHIWLQSSQKTQNTKFSYSAGDPEYLSRILIFFHHVSRIRDLGKTKKFLQPLLYSHIFTKKNYFIIEKEQNNVSQLTKNVL
jgi:hypothetical protein